MKYKLNYKKDYVGIDIAYHSLDYFAKVLSPEYKPSAAMDALMKGGTLGKKTGKGVYDWSARRPTIDLTKATKEYDIPDRPSDKRSNKGSG